MYQNLANQNPLVSHFNGYMAQNPNLVPFQNNQLINNNVHVMNNLTNSIRQHQMVQQNIPMYQQQMRNTPTMMPKNIKKNANLIEEMLKPVKIVKNENTNKDVNSNYRVRKDVQKQAKKGKINIKMTNTPYKNIIKDKIITKNVEDVKEEDLLVHKSMRGIDDNIEKFKQELNIKEQEKQKINDELDIEFQIENYDKHKKKFEYKESFIKNLPYEEKTFNENKEDFIDFYKKKQKEAEEGMKLCDQVLHNMIDEGIISKDELPTEDSDNESGVDFNLNSIIKNIETDGVDNVINPKMGNTKLEKSLSINSERKNTMSTNKKIGHTNNGTSTGKKLTVSTTRPKRVNTNKLVHV